MLSPKRPMWCAPGPGENSCVVRYRPCIEYDAAERPSERGRGLYAPGSPVFAPGSRLKRPLREKDARGERRLFSMFGVYSPGPALPARSPP